MGRSEGLRYKITDVAGFLNFVRLLPKTAGSLWLCVFGLCHHLGVKSPNILFPVCLLVLVIFHGQNPSGGEEMKLPDPMVGIGIATQGSRFPFSFIVCYPPVKLD